MPKLIMVGKISVLFIITQHGYNLNLYNMTIILAHDYNLGITNDH